MDHLEMWLRRLGAEMDASIPRAPIDDLYAAQLKKTLEAAAEAWHWYQGLAASGDPSGHMEYKIRWNGATEYSVQLTALGDAREAVYHLTCNTVEVERLLLLRDSLHGVLMAMGPTPQTRGPSWWPAFLRLASDAAIPVAETNYVLHHLAEFCSDSWTFERLQEHMLTYREHFLPLWRSLLEYGKIKPSDPIRYLPCV